MDANEKGDALEQAVRGIETTILRSFPGYSERTFRIESKKLIEIDGVRHEIDIYVTVALGPGYQPVFIFESKNWKDKVSKNDIIIFSEKIRATNAQQGFFVAKSYTSDAEAQAKRDPRLVLLNATELDSSAVMVPNQFHGLHVDEPEQMSLDIIPADVQNPRTSRALDPKHADFQLRGQSISLIDFINAWATQLRDEQTQSFKSLQAGWGPHMLHLDDERDFNEGEATVNGKPTRKMRLSFDVRVHVLKAFVVSAFDVATRGRSVVVKCETPVVTALVHFVQVDANAAQKSADR